jgi:hypothetical protein
MIRRTFGRLRSSIKSSDPARMVTNSGRDLSVRVNEPDSDFALRVMLNELDDLRRAVRELSMSVERFINFAGIIAVGAISYGVFSQAAISTKSGAATDSRGRLVLIFAPYALALVFGYIIQIYTDVETKASLKDYLEGLINKEFEKRKECEKRTKTKWESNGPMLKMPVLSDSTVNSIDYRGRRSVRLIGAINGGALFLLIFYSLRTTFRPHQTYLTLFNFCCQTPLLWQCRIPLFWVNVVGMLYILLALGFAVVELLGAPERVKDSLPAWASENSTADKTDAKAD